MRLLTVILSTLLGGMAFGQTTTNEMIIANQYKAAITKFTEALSDETIAPSTSGCPAGGFKWLPGTSEESGTLMSAKGKLAKLAPLALTQSKMAAATIACGTCKTVLAASPYVITRPAKIDYKAMCDNRPTQSFEGDFQSDRDAENFTEAILSKKNAEGQRLYAGCPDPCAFSVYAAKRTLENGKVRSTMTVACGQPRNTSILFAKYSYTYGTAVQWSCQK